MMVTNAWNPLGFHLLGELPKGNTFNVEYDRVNIIIELLPLRPQVDGRRLLFMLTTQNPTPRENAELSANKIDFGSPYTHPTYLILHHPTSLFGHIKHCLQGIAFPSPEELLAAIHEIAGVIPRPTLEDVFRN
jgi:hypothetical protein